MEFPGPFFKLSSLPSTAYGGHRYKDMLLTLPRLNILALEKSEMMTIFYFTIFCNVGEQETMKA